MTAMTGLGSPPARQWRVIGGVVLAHVGVIVLGLWLGREPVSVPVEEQPMMLEMPGEGQAGGGGATSVARPEPEAAKPRAKEPPRQAPTQAAVPVMPPQAAAKVAPDVAASPVAVTQRGGGGEGAGATTPNPAPSPARATAEAPGLPGDGRGAGHGGGAGQGDGGAWRARVLGHLERAKRYPEMARLMKREGQAQVVFVINRRGEVLSVRLAKGTGFPPLDQEAQEVVRRSQPLPLPPDEVPGERVEVAVPINFGLRYGR